MWHGQPRASLRSDGESKTCQKRSGREERDHVVGLGAYGLRAARGARVQPVRPGRTARRHAGTRGFARARAPTWTGFSASDTECLTELTISTSSAGAAVLISSSKIISEASVSWRLMVDMVLRGTRAGEDDHGSARARHGRSVRTCREKCSSRSRAQRRPAAPAKIRNCRSCALCGLPCDRAISFSVEDPDPRRPA